MSNIKISVIMPSLNVVEYIEECILSVINQTLKEIEIICVDAGSTDGTLDILNNYAKKDTRISIITSAEKSYGHQVNIGLKQAKGDYISIIETDDFIDETMFEKLYDLSDNGNIDIIKGTFYHYNDYDKNNIETKIDNYKSKLPNYEKFTLKENSLFVEGHPSIWAGIYRNQFLKDHKIKITEVPGGGWVDNPFFYETAISADSIVYIHKPFYYYRVSNPNSSSNNLKDFTVPLDRLLEIFKILDKYNCDDKNILVRFYNRIFRYIEIIIENNNNTDEDLDYNTCLKIHKIVNKVNEDIVIEELKFDFQKMYYKYISPLFLARFNKPKKVSNKDYELLFKENEFLYSHIDYFKSKFNETNYQKSQLEKENEEYKKLSNINIISLGDKTKKERKTQKTNINISEIKNKKEKTFCYKKQDSKYPLSVIMPIYNGSEFLEKSVNSLLNQTLQNFEIVFIDDGSTDNTLEILNNYKKKYDFITILTQENSGSGKARNYGINEAKGEYIAFLDADDFFIDNDALEKMYDIAKLNDANMVTANIKHDLDNQGEFVPFGPFDYYKSNDIILPEQYGIPWSFYKNIFKKDFLVENNIYFPDLLRGQDPVFLAKALTKVDKIYVVATDLYAYVYNSDTAKASNPKKLYDQLLHYRLVIDYLNIPKFSRNRNEYFKKILLFCSRLNDNSVVDAIESIRDIFKDMPDFLRRIENYIYLKFNHLPEVNEMISWPKVSIIMEFSNSEKFFENCFNSLIDQKINDFELLLINGFEDNVKYDYIKHLLKKEDWVKFIETENMLNLNIVLNNAEGDYVYFCDDSYIFENNLFEDMLETSLMTGSDICLCNTPEGGEHKNQEFNIKSILGNHNYPHYLSDWQEIIPHIFSSHFELPSMLYKKSLIQEISNSEELISDRSVLQIKSVLSTSKLSFVDKFLFNYQTKDNCYYTSRLPKKIDDALDIFTICDDVERFLKEKSLYDDLKTNFDIYKINQISSYLDYVRFVGCYSYNDPKNRDLYANNAKILDYSQYYGSKSENIGLNYSFANEYFTKAKYEFDKLDYRDLKFRALKNNEFSDDDMLNIYAAVLKSSSYEEYMNIVNFSVVEKLRAKNIKLKQKINDYETKNEDDSIENKLSQLKDENKILRDENNQLRNEYWENREEYEYILGSKSWKYTEWLRRK